MRVEGLGFRVWACQCLGFRAQGLRLRVQGLGPVQVASKNETLMGPHSEVQLLAGPCLPLTQLKVQGLGFRV